MKKQSGQVSRTLLVLAIVILVAAVGVFFFLRFASNQKAAQQKAKEEAEKEEPKPVYEAMAGDINFTIKSARDLGKVLQAPPSFGSTKPVKTTERFIQIIIGAQNKGKMNSLEGAWRVGDIYDSEGRSFTNVDNKAYFLLPQPNLCGTVLKPEFDPTPCMKIYEVSTESKGLKIEVAGAKQGVTKRQSVFLDINLK